MPERRNKTRRS